MRKSASIYTRVEPEIKEQAEQILSKLGIPVAGAINLFLHQVVLRKGIPFHVSLPPNLPLDYSTMTAEQFDAEIQKGVASLEAEKIVSAGDIRKKLQRQYQV
jgi:addiction module RelB/DinJ family antitoxin